ncbi:hypothetical protein T265_02281 [Opisthorchis viverrini]|uniref:Uncharacterized protein n=1 Tax=Opisthorchis viverrini TaxID=6198 RepID=A0A074ZVL0_OPIVI|nr:hypothetical protein T265_02281 [Opisthorchis viverrini]KER31513.1 hypothetical protein T265_02281 [Opisthorchis viverrini]
MLSKKMEKRYPRDEAIMMNAHQKSVQHDSKKPRVKRLPTKGSQSGISPGQPAPREKLISQPRQLSDSCPLRGLLCNVVK